MLQKYLKEILLVIIIFLIIGIYIINYYDKDIISDDNIISLNETINETKNNIPKETIRKYVDIKGAVKKPGVYSITNSTIINDVIQMAGGLNNNSYTDNINLSKKVKDEMVIYVYTKNEYKKDSNTLKSKIVYQECNCPEYDLTSCIKEKQSVIKYDENATILPIDNINETRQDNKININTASKEELMTLSGIGEAKANSIIEYRNDNGNFAICEDITKVTGISDKMYEKIKNDITV